MQLTTEREIVRPRQIRAFSSPGSGSTHIAFRSLKQHQHWHPQRPAVLSPQCLVVVFVDIGSCYIELMQSHVLFPLLYLPLNHITLWYIPTYIPSIPNTTSVAAGWLRKLSLDSAEISLSYAIVSPIN